MQKYPDRGGRTVPDIIDPENSTPKFRIIEDRVQDAKSRLQPRFDWRFLLLIRTFMTIKIVLAKRVTHERKCALGLVLLSKRKKRLCGKIYLEKTTNYNSFYLSPLCT